MVVTSRPTSRKRGTQFSGPESESQVATAGVQGVGGTARCSQGS